MSEERRSTGQVVLGNGCHFGACLPFLRMSAGMSGVIVCESQGLPHSCFADFSTLEVRPLCTSMRPPNLE
eukprot:COSAG01_NODE_5667_length_4111_cov_6.282154_4_plen_70_part_00